jgi:hypothetical protein
MKYYQLFVGRGSGSGSGSWSGVALSLSLCLGLKSVSGSGIWVWNLGLVSVPLPVPVPVPVARQKGSLRTNTLAHYGRNFFIILGLESNCSQIFNFLKMTTFQAKFICQVAAPIPGIS